MTTQTDNPKAALYRKLAAVAGQIRAVEKDGENKDQRYSYATPAAIYAALKPYLAEQKLAIVPSLVEATEIDTGRKSKSGSPYILTRVRMCYSLLDGETGEGMDVTWEAQAGTYGDDKGIAKAQTIALRTFLIQLFQIPVVDEDLDPDAAAPVPPRQQAPQYAGASYTPPPEPEPEPEDNSLAVTRVREQIKSLARESGDGLVELWGKDYTPFSRRQLDTFSTELDRLHEAYTLGTLTPLAVATELRFRSETVKQVAARLAERAVEQASPKAA